ncbi:putative polysaccharide biosynthesis protein [Desnuesiella massiliensis]|uniref:putative polysaccharide biosynthesis protein n=1 Tax=Desnuesiella massiliensis TaxID=1650662 RepID=UPI0006E15DE1|nr:polysaccharide biosynthesis protein [Desnuesiella massiliensis]
MKEQSTTKGFAVLSIAGILVKILSLLYVPLLLQIIGDEGYGIYTASYDIFSLIYVMTTAGMQVAVAKQVSELIALNNYKDAVKTFKIARALLLLVGTLASLLLMIFAQPIANATKSSKSFYAIIALSPTVLVTSVLSAYRGYFQGRSIMTPTAISQIIEQIANIVLSLFFAYILIGKNIELGAAGGTIGTTVGALIAVIYLMMLYKKHRAIKVTKSEINSPEVKRLSNKQLLKRLIKYGMPLTLSSGMQYLGAVIDMALVKIRLEVAGFGELDRNIKYALLGKYKTLIYVPLAIIAALSAAVLPAISRSVVLNDKKAVKEKINFALRVSYLISIPSAVGLAVLSKPLYTLLFSERFSGGAQLMQYGSIVVVLMAVVQIQTTILQSMNRLYIVLVSLGVGILAKLISNYIFIAMPEININGAIIGSILCFLIPMIINNIALRKTLKIRISLLKHAFKPLVASAFMGLIVYITYFNVETLLINHIHSRIISSIPTLVSIAVGMVVYGYGLILTGGITKKDLAIMPARLLKLIPSFVIKRIR